MIEKLLPFTGTVLMTLSIASTANASAIRSVDFTTNILSRNDDGSTGQVALGFGVNFYGLNFNSLYVNNNGNVTFDTSLSSYTPFNLTSTNRQIIAPFFADVDTRNPLSSVVTYGRGIIDGRNAFVVNWDNVGYFNSQADKLNQFQLVLLERSDTGVGNFDIEFNYDQIQWETGSASGGVNGFGGNSARAGFSNGTGLPNTFFELGSAVNGAFLDGGSQALISDSLNSDVLGRYVFTARDGEIVPEPFTIFGTGMAIGFGTFFKRKLAKKDTENK